MAEEPEQLHRLEDSARRRRDAGGAADEAARVSDDDRREQERGGRRCAQQAAYARRRQRQQDGTDREQRPLLVGDRDAERQPGEHRAFTICQQHGDNAQRAAEQFLCMADFDRAQRDRICGAQADDDGAPQQRSPGSAHARCEDHAEQRAGEQAGERDHPVDGERSAAPQRGQHRKRRAQHERAAVDRRQLQKAEQMAVHERREGRLCLAFVVVPGKAVEAQPGERARGSERDRRAGQVLA